MDIKSEILQVFRWDEVRCCMYFIVLSVLLSFILIPFDVHVLTTLRVIFGSVFVLFLPGYVATLVFFSADETGNIERLALSFGLSIALVPLSILVANQILGVEIIPITCVIVILGLILLLLAVKLATAIPELI